MQFIGAWVCLGLLHPVLFGFDEGVELARKELGPQIDLLSNRVLIVFLCLAAALTGPTWIVGAIRDLFDFFFSED